MVVHEGDACLCGGTACGNTGINDAELAGWSANREGLCPPAMQMCSLAPCPTLLPACAGGTCTSREPINIEASTWDASCEQDDECIIVHEGDPCSSCVCGGTAVNASAEPMYRAALEGVECSPGPDVCDCEVFADAWCDAGTCEPGVDPMCVGITGQGFFSDCTACGDDCDSISTPSGERNACGCSSSADCPCGLTCGEYEIAPMVFVGGICVD